MSGDWCINHQNHVCKNVNILHHDSSAVTGLRLTLLGSNLLANELISPLSRIQIQKKIGDVNK